MFTISAFADEIDMNLTTQMDVLEKYHIHHIEMRGVNGKNLSDCTVSEAKEIKAQMDARGFRLSAVGSPIGKIGITDDFAPHLEQFKRVLEIAHCMKTDYIRMFSFFIPKGDDPDRYQDAVLERWHGFITAAKGSGITLLHENEKEIYGDTAERCLNLLQKLDCDFVRATFDPANFVQCGVEVFPHAFELLRPYIAYMHIKDAKFSDGSVTPAGQGDGRVADVLSALQADGYDGFLSLEPHLADFEGFSALEQDCDETKPDKSKGALLFGVAADALSGILHNL